LNYAQFPTLSELRNQREKGKAMQNEIRRCSPEAQAGAPNAAQRASNANRLDDRTARSHDERSAEMPRNAISAPFELLIFHDPAERRPQRKTPLLAGSGVQNADDEKVTLKPYPATTAHATAFGAGRRLGAAGAASDRIAQVRAALLTREAHHV
jgi:hypothetical protein